MPLKATKNNHFDVSSDDPLTNALKQLSWIREIKIGAEPPMARTRLYFNIWGSITSSKIKISGRTGRKEINVEIKIPIKPVAQRKCVIVW